MESESRSPAMGFSTEARSRHTAHHFRFRRGFCACVTGPAPPRAWLRWRCPGSRAVAVRSATTLGGWEPPRSKEPPPAAAPQPRSRPV